MLIHVALVASLDLRPLKACTVSVPKQGEKAYDGQENNQR